MQPVQVQVLGTGISTPIIMDYMQNPFQVSVAVIPTAGTGTIQATVEYTMNFSSVFFNPTWNGTTATWFQNSGFIGANATSGLPVSGNFAFPVAAIRLNVSSAVATTAVTMIVAQASEAP